MSATVQPVVITPDLDRSLQFYTALFGAVEHLRIPEDGPTFYVGLTIGNGEPAWPPRPGSTSPRPHAS